MLKYRMPVTTRDTAYTASTIQLHSLVVTFTVSKGVDATSTSETEQWPTHET